MKKNSKKGLLVGILLGVSTFCLQGAEDKVNQVKFVKFKLADDSEVSLPMSVAQNSVTLKNFMKRLNLSGKSKDELNKEENIISLYTITKKQWNDIAAGLQAF